MVAAFPKDRLDKGSSWQLAIGIFSQASLWIVVPIVAALFIGNSLDARYDTAPIFFLSSVGLAFLVTAAGISRLGIRYFKIIDAKTKQNGQSSVASSLPDKSPADQNADITKLP